MFYIFIGLLLFWLALVYFLRLIWFFRDPLRTPPDEKGVIVSPADGKVLYIHPIKGRVISSSKGGGTIPLMELTGIDNLPEEGWAIGIYMSPLDVHFNYAPIAGRVTFWHRIQSSLNLPMVDLLEYVKLVYLRRWVDLFSRRFHLQNERVSIVIEGVGLKVGVVEIADKFVNKITSFVKVGEEIKLGQKIGFISRGSQVDLLIFRGGVDFLVKEGQQVYGTLTKIARERVSSEE